MAEDPDDLTAGVDLEHDAFAKNRDTPFLFGVAGECVRLDLVEIRDLAPSSGESGGGVGGVTSPKSFSLLFRGPGETPLAQGTYSVEHAAMGSFLLFIVPVGRDARGISYEAIFNHGA